MRHIWLVKPKSKWLIGSMIILSMILVFCTVYWYQVQNRSTPSFASLKKPPPLSPLLAIEGFAFDGYQGERKVLSIKADSLVIKKKKIGFFRFGLFNTAKLSKAVIDIYATEKILPYQDVITNGNKKVLKKIDFEEAFSPTILKSITPKQVSTLELEPAIIKVHNNNDIILTIESGYSKISRTLSRILYYHK